MLSARNIQNRKILFTDFRWIAEPDFVVEHARTQVTKGNVLLTIVGTIGRTAVVPNDAPAFALQRSVAVLKGSAAIEPRYLAYALESPAVQRYLEDNAKGTAQKGIYLRALASVEIPLAPLAEQKRIADRLDGLLASADACRDRLDRVPAILKGFRQAVLEAATSGSLTENWITSKKEPRRSVTLGEVATGFSYGSAAKSSPTGSVPVLRMGNIQNGTLDWTDLVFTSDQAEIEKYALRNGDVLFNRTNSPELVGKTAVYRGERAAVYAGYLIRVRCSKELLPDYLNYCLGSPSGRDYCWRVKSDGVSQSNINAKKLAAFPLELPGLEEQAEIVRRVDALFDLANTLEARLVTARAQANLLTPTLLQRAFCGELVPQDPHDEPAARLLERIASARQTQVSGRKNVSSSRRTDLKPVPKPSLSEIIERIPKSDFTFDELRQVATTDYESLKEELFTLLADESSGVEQFFDADVKSMKLRRIRK